MAGNIFTYKLNFMERYKPLFVITLAFIIAAWSYICYGDYQTVVAEGRIKSQWQINRKEVKTSHILVKTQDEAKELRTRILAGEDFAKLAEKFSFCPSGKRGGALGYITKGQTVPTFEEAAFSMQEDEISEPVKTEFGWHLIKVEEIVY